MPKNQVNSIFISVERAASDGKGNLVKEYKGQKIQESKLVQGYLLELNNSFKSEGKDIQLHNIELKSEKIPGIPKCIRPEYLFKFGIFCRLEAKVNNELEKTDWLRFDAAKNEQDAAENILNFKKRVLELTVLKLYQKAKIFKSY